MDTRLDTLFIEEATSSLLSALFGVTTDEIKQRGQKWRIVHNAIKADQKTIKKEFPVESEKKAVEGFFLSNVVSSYKYYSATALTIDEENELWNDFCKYMIENNIELISDSKKQTKERLVKCLNAHNSKIRTEVLTCGDELSHHLSQKGFNRIESFLRQINDTLCLDTELQLKNDRLDYLTQQIESILKSSWMDLQKCRNTAYHIIIFNSISVIVLSVILWMILKYYSYHQIVVFVIVSFIGMDFLITYVLLLFALRSVKEKEKRVYQVSTSLLDIHYKLYVSFLKKTVFPDTFDTDGEKEDDYSD